MSAEFDIVVLGAGPAGLATAWYATRRGFRVAVVDRADRIGGLAASVRVDDQSVDLGSHRLHASIRADLLADLRDEVGVDLQWRPRNGRIRMNGRWVAFPLRPIDLLRNSDVRFGAGVLADTVLAPRRRRRHHGHVGEQTFAGAVRTNLGPTIADAFYEPYARKLWAVDGDELSAELFARRVSARSAGTLIARTLARRSPHGFWYPPLGFGAICDGLAAGVRRHGGEIFTGRDIAGIRLDGAGASIDLEGVSLRASTLVSTIPSAALTIVRDTPPAVAAAAASLRSRAALLVYLTVPRPQYTPFDAHYFPEQSTIASRLSEPKNYRSSAHDPADRSVICVEVPATVGDETWRADEAVLGDRIGRELRQHGLPDPTAVAVHVERRTHVYPVYRLGFERDRDLVDAHLAGLPSLAVLGRQASFAHDNTHHALLMAKTVVEAIRSDGRLDPVRWHRLRQAFAGHVVED